jgi:hypothetical protein
MDGTKAETFADPFAGVASVRFELMDALDPF